MSVLTSQEIRERILKRNLIVSPIISFDKQIKNGSLDLRLGPKLITTKFTNVPAVNLNNGSIPEEERYKYYEVHYMKDSSKDSSSTFVLHPGGFVLGSSLEYLSFPNDLMAYVIGRSSLGRLGLIVATAVLVQPGFSGYLTLEITNLGNLPIVLFPGLQIAQLVFHTLNYEDALPYKGKYFHGIKNFEYPRF